MAEFLDSITPIETPLKFSVVAYVNRKSRMVAAVVLYSFLGLSYIDQQSGKIVPMQPDDHRLEMYRSYEPYRIVMDSESDFNKETGRPIAVDMFTKGELTEKWLKDNSGLPEFQEEETQGQ